MFNAGGGALRGGLTCSRSTDLLGGDGGAGEGSRVLMNAPR